MILKATKARNFSPFS